MTAVRARMRGWCLTPEHGFRLLLTFVPLEPMAGPPRAGADPVCLSRGLA